MEKRLGNERGDNGEAIVGRLGSNGETMGDMTVETISGIYLSLIRRFAVQDRSSNCLSIASRDKVTLLNGFS